MKKIIILLVISLLIPFSAYAEVSQTLLGAVQQLYNSNFSSAKKTADNHIAAHPDDPAGYLVRGMANEWYQLARNKGKTLNKKIMSDYQKARRLADAALKKDKNNLDKKVMLGNAYVYISKKQIDTGHKMQAGFSLKQAKNLMNEVLASNPGNQDANFAVGLFNYFAASVPPGFRWLANFVGFKGNRAKGLSHLQKAVSTRSLTQNDALYMLFYIYGRKEGAFSTGLNYASRLYKSFPSNKVFLFNYAEMLFRTKKIQESRGKFQEYFDYCGSHKNYCSRNFLFLSNYFMAWCYMDEKDYAGAKGYLIQAKKLDKKKYKSRTTDIKKWSKKAGI